MSSVYSLTIFRRVLWVCATLLQTFKLIFLEETKHREKLTEETILRCGKTSSMHVSIQ
jgi:hypothetical protein